MYLFARYQVFEEFQGFLEKYGDLSVVPTRHFLGKPVINEEMNIEIEAGKLLIVKLLAVGKINENTGTRECFFEVNAETRVVVIEDRQAAVAKVTRDKATSEPGSIGSPMAGVVVEVRVKEGSEVKAGDPICVLSAMKVSLVSPACPQVERWADYSACGLCRWNRSSHRPSLVVSSVSVSTRATRSRRAISSPRLLSRFASEGLDRVSFASWECNKVNGSRVSWWSTIGFSY